MIIPAIITCLISFSKFARMGNSITRVSRGMTTNADTLSPSNQRPLILLDVDGVILHSHGDIKTKEDDLKLRERKRIDESPFDDLTSSGYLYSPTVIQNINQWSTVAEMVWLTSWQESARTSLAPKLGLVDFPFSTLAILNNNYYLKKPETVMAHIAESHPDRLIIWVDDDVGYFKENAIEHHPTQVNTIFTRPNTLLVSPFHGLCPKHVDKINEILAHPELAREKPIEVFYPGEFLD